MISLLLGLCPLIPAAQNSAIGEVDSPEISARVMLGDDYHILGVAYDFVIVEQLRSAQGSNMEPSTDNPIGRRQIAPPMGPHYLFRTDGTQYMTLDDWYGEDSAFFPYGNSIRRLNASGQIQGRRGFILPDGTVSVTIDGIPILGGGEVVIVREDGVIGNPSTRHYSTWNESSGQWIETPMGGSQGIGPSIYGCTLAIQENGELKALPLPDSYAFSSDSQVLLKWADRDRVILNVSDVLLETESSNDEEYTPPVPMLTFIWREGTAELLPRPAESVVNIDGRRTTVTGWWAEVIAPDGRIVGYTECADAEIGSQSKYFVTVWDGDKATVLPLPEDIRRLANTGASSVHFYGMGYGSPFDLLSAERQTLSADSYGNISLAPVDCAGGRHAFLWDGNAWHNVTKALGLEETTYRFHLAPENRKAYLYHRTHPNVIGTGPVWLVEY